MHTHICIDLSWSLADLQCVFLSYPHSPHSPQPPQIYAEEDARVTASDIRVNTESRPHNWVLKFTPGWASLTPRENQAGRGEIGKFMKQKSPNQLCWLTGGVEVN